MGKTEKSSQSNKKSSTKSLCKLGKSWKHSLRLTLKNPNLNLWMNREKLGPNLSFSVQEASNLHEIRLFLFKTQ